MTAGMRWRIVALQAVLVLVLAGASAFAFYESSFLDGMIHDQLAAQKISFPPGSQIKPGGQLDPNEFPKEIQRYAGQQVDDGDKARVFANDYIAIHLEKLGGGKTYSQVSSEYLANPGNQQLANLRATLFQGETLRGMLLNAWGWSQVARYAFYAGIGLAVAALVVLAALVYELSFAPKPLMERGRSAGGRRELA